MSGTTSTSASSTSSTGSAAFASLSASTIDSIRQAALASAPPSAAAFINARFAGAPVASASSPAAAPAQPAAAPAQPAAAPAQPAAAPATTSDSNASSSIVGASLAQPTISFIREQILANAPSPYAQTIADQFTASTGSSGAVTPAQPVAAVSPTDAGTTTSTDNASSVGAVVDLLRQEVVENVPAEYAQYILAQLAGSPSASSATGTSVPATAGAAVQTSTVSDSVATYLTA